MESKVNYTIVGLFVVILGLALITVGFWFTAARHKTNYTAYLVYMDESVSGLSEQSQVLFNGVSVGYVNDISLNPANPQQVEIQLKIKEGVPINQSTTAQLMSQGVTGLTYVGLKAKAATGKPLTATTNQPYPVIPSVPSLLVQLDTVLREVTSNIKDMSESLSRVFTKANTAAFSASLSNIQIFTKTLATNADAIDSSIKSADVLLKNAKEASKQLPETMDNFQKTLNSTKDMTQSLSKTADQVKATMRDSQVMVQSIQQQALPSLISATDHLDDVLVNLQALSKELKQNPSAIIRPILPPPPGPGENAS